MGGNSVPYEFDEAFESVAGKWKTHKLPSGGALEDVDDDGLMEVVGTLVSMKLWKESHGLAFQAAAESTVRHCGPKLLSAVPKQSFRFGVWPGPTLGSI